MLKFFVSRKRGSVKLHTESGPDVVIKIDYSDEGGNGVQAQPKRMGFRIRTMTDMH